MKKCNKCRIVKNEKEFSKKLSHTDGLNSHCRKCVAEKVNAERKQKPWKMRFFSAKGRCTNPNNARYGQYGNRGIQMLMSECDCRFLWFRDNAFSMKSPHLHRIDHDKDYSLRNCRFIEGLEHRKLYGLHGKWSKKYNQCVSCGTREKRHVSDGWCQRCYDLKRNSVLGEEKK